MYFLPLSPPCHFPLLSDVPLSSTHQHTYNTGFGGCDGASFLRHGHGNPRAAVIMLVLENPGRLTGPVPRDIRRCRADIAYRKVARLLTSHSGDRQVGDDGSGLSTVRIVVDPSKDELGQGMFVRIRVRIGHDSVNMDSITTRQGELVRRRTTIRLEQVVREIAGIV